MLPKQVSIHIWKGIFRILFYTPEYSFPFFIGLVLSP